MLIEAIEKGNDKNFEGVPFVNGHKRKRPIWVWVISIYYFFSIGFGLLSYYLSSIGAIPLTPTQKAYFANLTIFEHGMTLIIGLIGIAGVIALFLMRKVALYLFIISFGAGLQYAS